MLKLQTSNIHRGSRLILKHKMSTGEIFYQVVKNINDPLGEKNLTLLGIKLTLHSEISRHNDIISLASLC